MKVLNKNDFIPKDKPSSRAINYVDKHDFLEELKKYRIARKTNSDLPCPDKIGLFFVKIANGLFSRGNFRMYTYYDDMVSDAVFCCLKYMKNFDPDKSDEPVSYFTQLAWTAFVRRIKTEKKMRIDIPGKIVKRMIESNEVFEKKKNGNVTYSEYNNFCNMELIVDDEITDKTALPFENKLLLFDDEIIIKKETLLSDLFD